MALLGISQRQLKDKVKEKARLTDEEAERAIAIIMEVAEGDAGNSDDKMPTQPGAE